MVELAHFQNFAKLKDTSVEFNDITVLAGKPGTGKSYVMKYFYAIKEFQYQDSIGYPDDKREASFEQLLEKLLINASEELSSGKHKDIEKILEEQRPKGYIDSKIYDNVVKGIKELHLNSPTKFKNNADLEKKKFITNYLNNLVKSIFTNHGQISDKYVVRYKNLHIKYDEEVYYLQSFKKDFIENIQEVIFVETPLILEFHKHIDRRKAKTPYHIESLMNILDEDYSFTNEEQDELIKTFSKKVNSIIGGDIQNRNGSFVYSRNNDKDYNIFNTSSGIKSIGLLQYLVTNKALKKGSVLFWEEPEVHLHPSWQLKMVDLFVELMNAGVKIVFSTHSPYMADYLNAISKRNGYRERISFNVLDEKEGVVTNHILDDDNWDILQKELMDTFEDILWQYL